LPVDFLSRVTSYSAESVKDFYLFWNIGRNWGKNIYTFFT